MKTTVIAVLVFLLLIQLASAGFFEWMIGRDPGYSPFPELAPFNVSVTVMSAGTSPIIHNLSMQTYVCEGNATLEYFNVTDEGGEALRLSVNPTIPIAPFFVEPMTVPANPSGPTFSEGVLRSFPFTKADVSAAAGFENHFVTVSAVERFVASPYHDDRTITVTGIEINNPPELTPFGTQTFVWTMGEDSSFVRQLQATDVEDGTVFDGILTFGLTFLNGPALFGISSTGGITYTPDASDFAVLPYTANIQLCADDQGIAQTHPDILLHCGVDGSPETTCFNFSLTVTNVNRAPIIDSYWHENLTLDVSGETELYFNVSAHDPDGNPGMDMNWTVDGVQYQQNLSINFSEFRYAFPCGVGGQHWINVTVTDGLANTTLGWNLSVAPSSCPTSSSGGGGGGGGGSGCSETWVCGSWNTCQHAFASLELETLQPDEYVGIEASCIDGDVGAANCGFHIRDCIDINECGTTLQKPDSVQQCYYTGQPSCTDGITNCHDGLCEILADCGGPCNACATCSDGIQNQGELGVDCEGPCPFGCPAELPRSLWVLRVILWAVFIALAGVILIKIRGILRTRYEMRQALQQQVAEPAPEEALYTNG